MGDRSNIFFRNEEGGIGVYGHWAGPAMASAAAAVLQNSAFRARVGDPNYATRIGVQVVLEELGASVTEETGFGLWTPITGADDNEYPYIVIDVNSGEVFVAEDWRAPSKKELVDDPTADRLAALMTGGEPPD